MDAPGCGHQFAHMPLLPFAAGGCSVTNPFLPSLVLSSRQLHDLSGIRDNGRLTSQEKAVAKFLAKLPSRKQVGPKYEHEWWSSLQQAQDGVTWADVQRYALSTKRSYQRFWRRMKRDATYSR